ncbi:MAG: hypothetical protein EOO39_00470 [Cytophagaceae bacterium]|nr:MAG: hypothetical protein EOO39_00470 [Cytophagaceae bacterium]
MDAVTEKKPSIDEKQLGENPLARKLKVLVRQRTFAKQYAFSQQEDMMLPLEAEVEYVPYTKHFRDAERRKRFMTLSPRAKELLSWIGYELEAGKDYVFVKRDRYMKEAGINSATTVVTAQKELIARGYISPTNRQSVFWIDPHHFFSGSRLQKYPTKIIDYQTSKPE